MLEKKNVAGAVDAVLTLLKAKSDSVSLVDQPTKIDLQFTLKQIPKLKHKTIPIDLPASVHYELREVCIFVKDLNRKTREYEATVQHYEELFSKHNIKAITKIIPLKALRTDYSLPSSKISLAKAYDLYLADNSVMGLLPGILGKIFYSKKKTVPVKVTLGAKDLKKEIDRAVNNTRCVIQGSGSSCLVTVAHDRMDKNQIVGNVLAACKRLMDQVPGGKDNIRNMYIKSMESSAVPLYLDTGSANNINLPERKPDKIATFTDEITTVLNGQVMISADGRVKVIKTTENETDDEEPESKVSKTSKKGKKDLKGSKKVKDGTEMEIKEEKVEDEENQVFAGNVDEDSDPEIIDSDNDDKDDISAEINKGKKSGKTGKKQRKRKSREINGDGKMEKGQTPVEEDGDGSDLEINVNVLLGKRKKSGGKVDKKQKKRKSEGKLESTPIEQKKVKQQTQIVNVKPDQKKRKPSNKGKKAKNG